MSEAGHSKASGQATNAPLGDLPGKHSPAGAQAANHFNSAAYSLMVDQDLPGIALVWKGAPSPAQMRSVHEAALLLLTEYQASKLLWSFQGFDAPAAGEQGWLVHNWLPRARRAGLAAAAVVPPMHSFLAGPLSEVAHSSAPSVQLRSFDTAVAARAWLRSLPGTVSQTPPPILLVEDHQETRDMLARLLKTEGYRSIAASTPHEALALVQGWTPSLIITDFRMPGMSGLEMLEEVREKMLLQVPVIMFSGEGDDLKLTAMRAGVDVYITKDSLDWAGLRREVQRLVGPGQAPKEYPHVPDTRQANAG